MWKGFAVEKQVPDSARFCPNLPEFDTILPVFARFCSRVFSLIPS
jgi:hypothetical protein